MPKIKEWKTRPVGQIQYLVVDASYEPVRIERKVVKAAVLVAFGVDYEGKRHILGVEAA